MFTTIKKAINTEPEEDSRRYNYFVRSTDCEYVFRNIYTFTYAQLISSTHPKP